MTSTSAYETLYNNMKKHFTVISENNEYTLGEYMSMKADVKNTAASNLPAVRSNVLDTRSVSAIFSYVNEKLTVNVGEDSGHRTGIKHVASYSREV